MKPEDGHTGQDQGSKAGLHWIIWLLVLAIVGAGFYFARPYLETAKPQAQSTPAEKPSRPATSVYAKAAELGNLPVYLNGLGTVTGLRTVTVKSRVDGELI